MSGANITIVLDGLDRASGNYTDPVEKMKKELEEIKADDDRSPPTTRSSRSTI